MRWQHELIMDIGDLPPRVQPCVCGGGLVIEGLTSVSDEGVGFRLTFEHQLPTDELEGHPVLNQVCRAHFIELGRQYRRFTHNLGTANFQETP
jgi:hypothetical protein